MSAKGQAKRRIRELQEQASRLQPDQRHTLRERLASAERAYRYAKKAHKERDR